MPVPTDRNFDFRLWGGRGEYGGKRRKKFGGGTPPNAVAVFAVVRMSSDVRFGLFCPLPGARIRSPHTVSPGWEFYHADRRLSSPVEIQERLLPLVVLESLAVAVRDVEEFGLAGGGGAWDGG